MATLTVVENLTLDGVMQSPGRADEDTRNGFTRGGWASEYLGRDPAAAQASMAGMGSTIGFVFGHRTYDDLVGYWLTTTDPNPFSDILRSLPKYVASHRADAELPHPNSTLLSGDAVQEVARLKESLPEGSLVVLGSGVFVRDLAAAGLVDTFLLTTIPVVLGTGTRLFGDTFLPLTVESSATSPTGIVVATYSVGDVGPRD